MLYFGPIRSVFVIRTRRRRRRRRSHLEGPDDIVSKDPVPAARAGVIVKVNPTA